MMSRSVVTTTDPFGLHGRDDEMSRILELVLSKSSEGPRPNLLPILIVGIREIGKTALARQVFDDGGVKANRNLGIYFLP